MSEAEQENLLQRPAVLEGKNIGNAVSDVIESVRSLGDSALLELTKKYDNIDLATIRVSDQEIENASTRLDPQICEALNQAYRNIEKFHSAQKSKVIRVETQPGVVCEQLTRPIQSVGLYIPGGSAPLPSTVLMLGVPAQIAQCGRVVLYVHHLLLPMKFSTLQSYAELMRCILLAEPQAIAAMAYGTQTIVKVDKIFGPGNAYAD